MFSCSVCVLKSLWVGGFFLYLHSMPHQCASVSYLLFLVVYCRLYWGMCMHSIVGVLSIPLSTWLDALLLFRVKTTSHGLVVNRIEQLVLVPHQIVVVAKVNSARWWDYDLRRCRDSGGTRRLRILATNNAPRVGAEKERREHETGGQLDNGQKGDNGCDESIHFVWNCWNFDDGSILKMFRFLLKRKLNLWEIRSVISVSESDVSWRVALHAVWYVVSWMVWREIYCIG